MIFLEEGLRFVFLNAWEAYRGNSNLSHCRTDATMVIYEQLRCQKQASEILGLTKSPESVRKLEKLRI